MEKYLNYKVDVTVQMDDADYRGYLKPGAILRYFQSAATEHAEVIGLGFDALREKNMFWVVTAAGFNVLSYPAAGEKVTVVTCPKKPDLAFAYRDYYVFNDAGGLLIEGTSKWCALDVGTSKVRRCSELFNYSEDKYNPNDSFAGGNARLRLFEDFRASAEQYKNEVKITDLDRNMHMNNSKYGDVILNCCSVERLNKHKIKTLRINFLKEMRLKDLYTVFAAEEADCTSFEAVKNDGNAVFRAQIEWF